MDVGVIFLTAFINLVFQKLTSPELINFVRREGIHNSIKKWKSLILKIQAVLSDAEEKQITNQAVKIWLDELRDLAYDVDDILDEFATEALRRKMTVEPQAGTSKVRSLIPACCKPSSIMFNFRMESKINGITSRLQEISKQKTELNLIENNSGGTSTRTRDGPVNQTSSVPESHVYGREEDKEAIVDLLLSYEESNGEVCVIPIIGMGGVGKTTLANIVYNDNRVKGYFDLQAWVCVSDEFDISRVTRAILQSLKLKTKDFEELSSLQESLKEKLSEQKFLLVLDDVWHENYNDWTILRRPLEAGAPGSKIIVTARNQGVASKMGTIPAYHLKELSNDGCLSIFTQHALGATDFSAHLHLKQIGEEIVKRCKGLPLAAKVLGGLLRITRNLDEWKDVLHSQIWDLSEGRSNIIPALRLSYYHLSPPLKQCFAYCSILPKDYEFKEEELVLLWMAEGLLRRDRKQMEDIGGEYFRDLLSRSFFQLSSLNESRFVMHDLISDLAQWVAGETCLRLEDKLEPCKISNKVRHSSYVGRECDGYQKFEAFEEAKSLRTFLLLMTPQWSYLTNKVPLNLLPKLTCLRVLSLSGYRITELPDLFGDLRHLRYLDLSRTEIRILPESTSTLYNLQTLILKDCFYLKRLPTAMGNLINLCHLDFTNANSIIEMPLRVGQLTSLQRLSNFIVGNGSGSGIRELMNLKRLRGTLCISQLENVTDARDAREANLKDKQDLDMLTMGWSSEFNDLRTDGAENKVLDMLQPYKGLKELTIKCYGGVMFPTWVGDHSFSNMVFLTLENCVKCTSLPALGQLPLLKNLHIKGMNGVTTVGLEFNGRACPKPFPSLEVLSFEDMQEWERWSPSGLNGQVEVFLRLCELSIKRCPKLSEELPNHLPSLKKLVIDESPQLAFSISSFPDHCELDIQDNPEVVKGRVSSLKSLVLCNISKLPHLTQGFVQGLKCAEDLEIVGSDELTSLWQQEVGLLHHLTSLHRLRIEGCPRFVSLVTEEAEQQEEQQQGLPCKLESLELDGCNNLEKLQGLHHLTSLRALAVKECPKLVSFPEIALPSMLRELTIRRCNALISIPRAMMHCNSNVSLQYLCIECCDSIVSITEDQLPLTLKKLEIKFCKNLLSIQLEDEGSTLSSCSSSSSSLMVQKSNNSSASLLEELSIFLCESLTSLSSRGELPSTLKNVSIYGCPQLELVAESFHNNTSLEKIEIQICDSLKSLPKGLHSLTYLSSIYLWACQSLVSFPDGGLPTTKLRDLYISSCKKLETLPDRMHELTSLQQLTIHVCPGILSFPGDGFPTNLKSLSILDLMISEPLLEWGLHRLSSLTHLNIVGGCPDLVSFPVEEKGMMLPTSLVKLSIKNFPNVEHLSKGLQSLTCLNFLEIDNCPKLKSLVEEGMSSSPSKGFQNLTSLEELLISKCPNLKSLPEEGLPPSLLKLFVSYCTLLTRRCKKDQGRDWTKIAHIPCIYIDRCFMFY